MRARLPFLRRRPRRPGHYPPGPLRDLAAAPPPPGTTPVSQVELLALDLETTGLDPRTDHVLSLGWVPVAGGQVLLADAHEHRVRPPDGVDVGSSRGGEIGDRGHLGHRRGGALDGRRGGPRADDRQGDGRGVGRAGARRMRQPRAVRLAARGPRGSRHGAPPGPVRASSPTT